MSSVRSSLNIVWILGLVLLLLIVGGVGWFLWQPDGIGPQGGPIDISPEEAARQIAEFNVALGELENGVFGEAAVRFSDLQSELPTEEAIGRNRAIAAVLALDGIDQTRAPAEFTEAASQAATALETLEAVAPDSAVTALIRAAYLDRVGDEAGAVSAYQRAAEIDPHDPSTWYEFSLFARNLGDEAAVALGQEALARAHQLVPENLWVLAEYLLQSVTEQEPKFVETLSATSEQWNVIRASVRDKARVDVVDLLNEAGEAAAEGNWNVANARIRILTNVARPEDAVQSDRLRIERHPLELVATEVSGELAQAAEVNLNVSALKPFSFEVDPVRTPQVAGTVRDVRLVDFNLDGRQELITLTEASLTVWDWDEDGSTWTELIEQPLEGEWTAIAIADLDDDAVVPIQETVDDPTGLPHCHRADVDVLLSGPSGLLVFENGLDDSGKRVLLRRETAFEDVEVADVALCRFGDFDMDGDLDLLVSSMSGGVRQFSNRGNLTFRELDDSPHGVADGVVLTSAVVVDFDRDIDLDVICATEQGEVGWLENLKYGRLRWRAFEGSPVPLAGQHVDVAEIDGNASWDLIVVQLTHAVQHDGGPFGSFVIADVDNDSFEDVVVVGEGGVTLIRRLAAKQPAEPIEGAGQTGIRRLELADFDRDGGLDLMVVSDQLEVLKNDGGSENAWIDVGLVGEQVKGTNAVASKRVNHYGLGSLLELRAGGRYQARFVRRPTTRFGLGPEKRLDTVRVVWTNGIPEHLVQPETARIICEKQTLISSCPYLYTWNGERFTFVTDLLWAAPLGLRDTRGEMIPDRPWEYLWISGEQLQERDGVYELRITEELREAGYFDEVRLIAVDSPKGVQVCTNEKVGPPSIAEHRLHTARRPVRPVAATNGNGRDLLPELLKRDEDYARPFDRKTAQGYTEDSIVELDFGPVGDVTSATLFLTGWLYPSDAGVTAAIRENPELTGPVPLSLWVPDESEKGSWRQAIPFTGFPGGKTKTIAIDVGDVLPSGRARVQLRTSMEICWDEIFLTINEDPVDTRAETLELVSAELRYRGHSVPVEHPDDGPETYNYDVFSAEAKYLPMEGAFTRFGDVAPLLTEWDDRMVVMGPGDEMVLTFRVPSNGPPAGWQRGFVLYNVGWDKDAQQHTVYGQSSEPLPYRAMPSYPYSEPYPSSPELVEYLERYQTRRLSGVEFRRRLHREQAATPW
ncbi:TPR_REGION domain-containing protein [Durusdinium trenchii]|uniref:TPR_REGION domain-containing protein n=1 Tax=Durusdinium trenchii TaxID=1381693 RepID=A0ABP0J2N9_9DINO